MLAKQKNNFLKVVRNFTKSNTSVEIIGPAIKHSEWLILLAFSAVSKSYLSVSRFFTALQSCNTWRRSITSQYRPLEINIVLCSRPCWEKLIGPRSRSVKIWADILPYCMYYISTKVFHNKNNIWSYCLC